MTPPAAGVTREERIPDSIEDVKSLMISTGSRFKEWTPGEIEGARDVYEREGLVFPPDVEDLLTDGDPLPDPRSGVQIRTPDESESDQTEEIADETLLDEARGMIRDGGTVGAAGMLELSYPTVERSRIDRIVDTAAKEVEIEKQAEVSIKIGEYRPSPSVTRIPRILNAATWGIVRQTVTERRDQDGKITFTGTDTQDLFDYFLESATVHINPLEPSEETYTLRFRDAEKRDLTIHYEEEPLRVILDDLPGRPGVKAKRLLPEAVTTILHTLRRKGRVTVERRAPATGFFEDEDGRIFFSKSKRFEVEIPEYSRRKTREVLKLLDTFMGFYAIDGDTSKPENRDHFLTALYYFVQAPLGAIRKQHGRENRPLLLGGEPHVGKTILEKICAGMWGISLDRGIVGASKLTVPQLAEHLDRTTLPISFDEVRNALSDAAIADVLKASTTGMLIKERILSNQGFRRQRFMAYASPIMSTNFVPELYVGVRERLIPVNFTVRNKRERATQKETNPEGEEIEIVISDPVKTFETALSDGRDLLPYFGSGIRELLLSDWQRLRDAALQDDQVEAGRQVLTELYRYTGLDVPPWLRPVETKYEIAEPDPVEEICKFLAEDLLKRLQIGMPRGEGGIDWDIRLETIRLQGLTPPYLVRISKDRIALTTDVIKEIARSKKVEIVGGLTGLMARIQQHPRQAFKQLKVMPDSGRKVVYLDIPVFLSYVETGVEDQSEVEKGSRPEPDAT